jgi:CelD/BcsL family acetyltransferase involved in cellulose biosynthesis
MRTKTKILKSSNSKAGELKFSMLYGTDKFNYVRSSWKALFNRVEDAWPYSSPAWAEIFIEGGRVRGEVCFAMVWDGDLLVGMLGFQVREIFGVRMAEPLGTGFYSYTGILVDPDYEEAVEVMAIGLNNRRVAKFFNFNDVHSEDTTTEKFFNYLCGLGYARRRAVRNRCFVVDLEKTIDEYLAKNKNSKRRNSLKRRNYGLDEDYAAEFECYSNSSIDGSIIGRLRELQERSWMKERKAAVFCIPFYRQMIHRMANNGLASAWILKINGVDAAFSVAFNSGRKSVYAWTAFDRRFEKLSVGTQLLYRVIDNLGREGYERLDFGHGYGNYKEFWATSEHTVDRVILGTGSGKLLLFYYKMKWEISKVQLAHRVYHKICKWRELHRR